MLRASSGNPDDIRPTTTHSLTRPPGPSWHGNTPGNQSATTSFHDSQRSALLMGNKHGTPGENIRSHAPATAPGIPEGESSDRTRLKEEGSTSNASSGVGSESPDKISPGVVRNDTADWLAQIGTSGQVHHGRAAVTVGMTISSSNIIQCIAATTVSSEPRHYYSSKDLVYTSSTSASPASLQYTTHVTPSTVNLSTIPSYSPYLSPYALPYVGYPHSALTQGIESYSAMLASMGNQVQQAQAHLPSTPFMTPGVGIPSPYSLGIPGLTSTAKSSLPETVSSAIAYIGGNVLSTSSLLPTSHSLSTGIVSADLGGHVPGVMVKIEDRQERLQNKELEPHRHEQELNRYIDSGSKHVEPREARVSPFEIRTSPESGNKPDHEHVKTGRDSGVPESPRQPGFDLSPSGKVDSSRQQYYREIGIGTVKLESGNGHSAQTFVSASRSDVHGLHRGEHGPEGIRTHTTIGKSSVISRTPPIASPIPSTIHMSSRLVSSNRQQHSPQSGLILSPTPQVRPSPSIATTLQPTSVVSKHQVSGGHLRPESHRFVSTSGHDHQRSSATEPSTETDQYGHSPLTNVPSYFTRGSIIQLANGELRRVEDLRTEDFVQSAELTEGLKIDSSTVLKVEEDHRRGVAHIGFLVGEQKAQVTVEAPMEHPFFVFGQGWSAVQPDRSHKSYGLVCHSLAVGDVCVSLTVKENGRAPSLQKERVVADSFHSGRDVAREPGAKRVRTEINLRQSPDEKPPLTQTSYYRQTVEGALHSNHIPGYPGHLVSNHASFQLGLPVQGSTSCSSSTTGEYSGTNASHYKLLERVDVDKNANTVIIQTNTTAAIIASSKQSPHMKVMNQPIVKPLKRRWSDPVKAAEPPPQQETLPLPVHPETLMKQTGGQS